ncbi:MAG: hypothetical protein OES09_14150, partial [Gammaproteobacteria bacterium]|nr:hypothetical protein [Gammaproteobacteria bacterium]
MSHLAMFSRILAHYKITRTHLIARRYFVVNGFDGALTMLGLIVGFYVSGEAALSVIVNASVAVT